METFEWYAIRATGTVALSITISGCINWSFFNGSEETKKENKQSASSS